ncbi:hypothetical protein ACWEPZ_13530 [Streptomyces sp. NPDC004288]
MTDVVRVVVLGVLALGVVVMAFTLRSVRSQVDDLRAEVACLRIERILGEPAAAAPADRVRPRSELGIIVGALVGAATATGATWLLWG